ncbi:MAG: LLM class flavin-dependent oxidoreductase [Chloroflexi bacterium]|nr:LLM class flavin-dependent oxidoreductase [Chloroflexota bacterium]
MKIERPTIGIHLPGASSVGLASGAEYAAFCREAEALGFDALWVEDRVFHPAHVADSLTLLTWAAANTERVLLGTAVLLLNLRQAPLVARQVSTLQHLSGGRAVLGLSIGGSAEEYAALGVPIERRVGVFREGLAVLRELLSGELVRPGAQVPILIGGGADAAIRRAGALGDGWIMGPFGDLDGFARGRELARAGGRRRAATRMR